MSEWDVRVECSSGMSEWDVRVECPSGMSEWNVRVECQVECPDEAPDGAPDKNSRYKLQIEESNGSSYNLVNDNIVL